MDRWFTEEDEGQLRFGYALEDVLFESQSKFQKVEVFNTKTYGKMLTLDGFVMITERDEFVYHELISHIPLLLHKKPSKIVVIGGGDGGTVRELVKHPEVERITLCEIDSMVVDVSRKFFPAVSCELDNKKVDINIGDGVAYIKELENEVDVIIIDSTDPIGPGEGLFSREFYKSVSRALKPGGVMVAQSESPWYDLKALARIFQNISSGFENILPYVGVVPTYPRGFWSWTMASNSQIDPKAFDRERFAAFSESLKYLTEDICTAAFALPKFFQQKIDESLK